MNVDTLAEELGLENDELLEIAELYVESCASDFHKIQSAINENNPALIAEAAHSIKGASGNLGFTKAHQAAAQMENQARRGSLTGIAETAKQLKSELDQVKSLFKI